MRKFTQNIQRLHEEADYVSPWADLIPTHCIYEGKTYRILNIDMQGGYFSLHDGKQGLSDIDMDKCQPTDKVQESVKLNEAVYEIPVTGDWGSLNKAEKWVPVSKDLYDQWKGKKRMDGKVSEDNFANVGDKFEQTWKSTQVFQDPKNKPANINMGDKITISTVIDPNTFLADFGGVKFTITTDELAKFKKAK